jgi:hypothetical protein
MSVGLLLQILPPRARNGRRSDGLGRGGLLAAGTCYGRVVSVPGFDPTSPVGFTERGDMTPYTEFTARGDAVPWRTNATGDVVPSSFLRSAPDGSPSRYVVDGSGRVLPTLGEVFAEHRPGPHAQASSGLSDVAGRLSLGEAMLLL